MDLTTFATKLVGALQYAGGFIVIWGVIQLAMALREQAGSGNQLEKSILTIVAGVLIGGAAIYLTHLSTSWAS